MDRIHLKPLQGVEMTAVILALVIASTGLGAFQQTDYQYTSENIRFTGGPAFIICSTCPPPAQMLPARSPVSQKTKPIRIEIPRPLIASAGAKTEYPQDTQLEPDDIYPQSNEIPTEIADTSFETITVFFDLNSSVIKESEKPKLAAVSNKDQYVISGYTCDKGSQEYNDQLALKRAIAVRNYLKIEAEVVGKGKCCYLKDGSQTNNRRVEIVRRNPLPKKEDVP